MKIDGLFYEKGEVIRPIANQKLTSACIVNNDGIEIIELNKVDESTLKRVKDNKWSIFQQCLLVKDKVLLPCLHFEERKNVRPALIQFDQFYCVGESDKKVTIKEFSQALVNIGAISAVNLDMGSWSEGWYQNEAGAFITIGEKDNMRSTNLQSNWILVRKGK